MSENPAAGKKFRAAGERQGECEVDRAAKNIFARKTFPL